MEKDTNKNQTKKILKQEKLIKRLDDIYLLSSQYNNSFINEIANVLKDDAEEGDLINILEDKKNNYGSRLMAFYSLCVKYRRGYDTTDFYNILKKYEEFKSEQVYLFQQLVYYKTKGDEKTDFDIALSIWDELNINMKKIPGIIQAYGDMIASMFEKDILFCENESDNSLRKDAISKISGAIKSQDYPKFYSTLGRLHAAGGDYKLGIKNIKIAIDKENSDAKDYPIRVNGYQTHILQIKVKMLYQEELAKINIQKQELENIKEAVEKSKYDSLAFLGFFVALISFIFGSFTIAEGLVFVEKVQMILILCGGLILAFSLLRHILKTFKDDNKDTIFMAIGGILLILFALLFVPGLVR